ncbi:hypothetical protein RI367_007586 [Sorochytrium milnesiophthora]
MTLATTIHGPAPAAGISRDVVEAILLADNYETRKFLITDALLLDESGEKLNIVVDMVFNFLLFTEDAGFTTDQTACALALLMDVHAYATASPLIKLKNDYLYFANALFSLGVAQPPTYERMFALADLQKLHTQVLHTYFRHYTLYKHAFTRKPRSGGNVFDVSHLAPPSALHPDNRSTESTATAEPVPKTAEEGAAKDGVDSPPPTAVPTTANPAVGDTVPATEPQQRESSVKFSDTVTVNAAPSDLGTQRQPTSSTPGQQPGSDQPPSSGGDLDPTHSPAPRSAIDTASALGLPPDDPLVHVVDARLNDLKVTWLDRLQRLEQEIELRLKQVHEPPAEPVAKKTKPKQAAAGHH